LNPEIADKALESYRQIKAAAKFHARCDAEADDLAQEAFIWAVENAHKYDPSRASFATWACLGVRDQFGRIRRAEIRRVNREKVAFNLHMRRESVDWKGIEKQIGEAMESLSERDRAVVARVCIDGKQPSLVAKEFRLSVGNVWQIVSRSKKKMQEAVA
jgi:RNA polymerase sigma factor (sigma-70 family)